MADDKRRAYAHSGPGGSPAGPEEPSLGGGAPRESVGERLKRERETYGLHLREVSESLRIRHAYLDAIERSAFDELPGPTYAIGFVRGYAQFLGLDDDRIVQRFKDESQEMQRDQRLQFPQPVNEGKIPGVTILVLSFVLIAAAYGGWLYLSDGQRSVADLVPAVPESLQRMVGATEAPPVPDATDLSGGQADAPASVDSAGGSATTDRSDSAENDGTPGAGDATGLPTEQIAELPETAPDPEPSGAAQSEASGASPADRETQQGAPDPSASDPSASDPSVSDPSASNPGANDPGDAGDTAAPDTAAPETADRAAASAETSAEAGSLTGAAASDGDIPAAPTAESANPAGRSEPTGPAEDQTQALAAPDDDGAAGPDGRAGDTPAPPAVPGRQQDDGGGATDPQRTRTAGTETAGGDTGASGRTFGAGPANSRVALVATARSWVQVRGPDDSLVLTRLLRPGDRYNVPDRPGLTLQTGNAGGLRVVVDGQKVGQLGGDGEVRRGVLLEPQALAAGG